MNRKDAGIGPFLKKDWTQVRLEASCTTVMLKMLNFFKFTPMLETGLSRFNQIRALMIWSEK